MELTAESLPQYIEAIRPAQRGVSDKYSWNLYKFLKREAKRHGNPAMLRAFAPQLDFADFKTFRPYKPKTAGPGDYLIGFAWEDGMLGGVRLAHILNGFRDTSCAWPWPMHRRRKNGVHQGPLGIIVPSFAPQSPPGPRGRANPAPRPARRGRGGGGIKYILDFRRYKTVWTFPASPRQDKGTRKIYSPKCAGNCAFCLSTDNAPRDPRYQAEASAGHAEAP